MPAVAYPTLRRAAEMIGVSPSTLSRDHSFETIPSGRRDQRVRAADVLRLADLHQKRPVTQVAQELVDYAVAANPEFAASVEKEVDMFFAQRVSPQADPGFIEDLKHYLPDDIYRRVRIMFKATEHHRPADVVTSLELADGDENPARDLQNGQVPTSASGRRPAR